MGNGRWLLIRFQTWPVVGVPLAPRVADNPFQKHRYQIEQLEQVGLLHHLGNCHQCSDGRVSPVGGNPPSHIPCGARRPALPRVVGGSKPVCESGIRRGSSEDQSALSSDSARPVRLPREGVIWTECVEAGRARTPPKSRIPSLSTWSAARMSSVVNSRPSANPRYIP